MPPSPYKMPAGGQGVCQAHSNTLFGWFTLFLHPPPETGITIPIVHVKELWLRG